MRKFDTCFFERYAQICLETILGEKYAGLVNEDRPDLQMPDKSIGIEVTRAMEPAKDVAKALLKEMAGLTVEEKDKEEIGQILSSGYGYGLPGLNYMGALEHEYWSLALPLKRILTSKIRKVASGFYGNFNEFGLFVFCRDMLDMEQVEQAVTFTLLLQDNLDIRFNTLYLSQTDTLYVCRLTESLNYEGIETRIEEYKIPDGLRRELFFKSLGY